MDILGELNPVGGGDPIPLLKENLLIGRRVSCDITLKFPNISSHHCELQFLNGYWFVKDLGSSNGIKINGKRCDSGFLHPDDELSVAKNVYRIEYQPTGNAPPPIEEEEGGYKQSLMEKAGLEKRRPKPTSRTKDRK